MSFVSGTPPVTRIGAGDMNDPNDLNDVNGLKTPDNLGHSAATPRKHSAKLLATKKKPTEWVPWACWVFDTTGNIRSAGV